MSFQVIEIQLKTQNLQKYAQFLTDVFDCQLESLSEISFRAHLPGFDLVVAENKSWKKSSDLVFHFYSSDIQHLYDLKYRTELYYYCHGVNQKIEQETPESFSFADPDQRIWKAQLRIFHPKQADLRNVSDQGQCQQ